MVRLAKDFHQSLSSLLMTPIQRITRYPLLLDEVDKFLDKARLEAESQGGQLPQEHLSKIPVIKKVLGISNELADYANDMMIAGRIRDFNVSNPSSNNGHFGNQIFKPEKFPLKLENFEFDNFRRFR